MILLSTESTWGRCCDNAVWDHPVAGSVPNPDAVHCGLLVSSLKLYLQDKQSSLQSHHNGVSFMPGGSYCNNVWHHTEQLGLKQFPLPASQSTVLNHDAKTYRPLLRNSIMSHPEHSFFKKKKLFPCFFSWMLFSPFPILHSPAMQVPGIIVRLAAVLPPTTKWQAKLQLTKQSKTLSRKKCCCWCCVTSVIIYDICVDF